MRLYLMRKGQSIHVDCPFCCNFALIIERLTS